MNFLIINSHPYQGSFNIAASGAAREAALKSGHKAEVLDLVKDAFNPVMNAADLEAWRRGVTVDPLVQKYKEAIERADILVFAFPIWWGAMPAVLKGFFDKVFLPGWAYAHNPDGSLKGLLGAKKAIVITTMETPGEVFENYYNNPVKGAFLKDTLETCSIELLRHFQIDKILSAGHERAAGEIDKITAYVAGL